MEKLKDAKKIKWEEDYTPKTEFLKNQFAAVVGKGSYRRWVGNEIGGPGKWYVVVSPADVHEHKRAKFFAGVRKLPDSYPAGGKYFDTIREAYEYAYETWGTPMPPNVPHYTSGDLKGIAKKVEKWKEIHSEDHEKKEASTLPFDVFRIQKVGMARAAVRKSPLFFDITKFIPILEKIDLSDPQQSDKLYEAVLASSDYKTREEVEKFIDANEKAYLGEAETLLPGSGRRIKWNKENAALAEPNLRQISDNNFFNLAAIIMTVGRNKRETAAREFLGIVGSLKGTEAENIDRRFYRSNFEEAILSAWKRYQKNVKNLENCYDFSYYMFDRFNAFQASSGGKKMTFKEFKRRLKKDPDFKAKWTLTENNYPIKLFVSYGRRDSSSGYWVAAPYSSDRRWKRRITITKKSFKADEHGFSHIDYAILNGFGVRKGSLPTEEFIKLAQEKLSSLGDVPKKIKDYFLTGTVSGSGIKSKGILNQEFSPREFRYVLDYIKNNIIDNDSVIRGLIEAFTGWVVFIKNEGKRQSEGFRQEVQAKAYGAFYGGSIAISDMVSRESLTDLLEEESDTICSSFNVPKDQLKVSLTKLKGLTEENSALLMKIIEALDSNADQAISFEGFLAILKQAGASKLITKENAMFLFSDSLLEGNEIPKISKRKLTFASEISANIGGKSGTAAMIQRYGLVEYVKVDNVTPEREAFEKVSLDPRQRAILAYNRKRGWNNITEELEKVPSNFVSRMVLTRIMKNQVELIDGKPVRVFSDDEIKNLITNYKIANSTLKFLDFKKNLQDGDVKVGVYTNGDGLVAARLSLTDYFFWKVMKNRFKYAYNLAESNPQLYEDILRTFLVPNDLVLMEKINSIGRVKFVSNGKEVNVDSKGNTLVFRGGVKAIDKKGNEYIPDEKIDTVFTTSPEENAKLIEAALEEFFSDKKNRMSYNLRHSFSGRSPIKTHHPSLSIRKYGEGSTDFSSSLRQLREIQKRVIEEVARSMVSSMIPGGKVNSTMALPSDASYVGDEMSQDQMGLVKSLIEAVSTPAIKEEVGDKGKKAKDSSYSKIRAAFRAYSLKTGIPVPYIAKNFLARLNQQLSPSSITHKFSANLGYQVFLDNEDGIQEIGGGFDISKNAMNAALVTNSSFREFCIRYGLCDGASEAFNLSKEETEGSPIKFGIRSRDLSACSYLRSHEFVDEKEAEEKLLKIETAFVLASSASIALKRAISEAIDRRNAVSPTPTRFDIFIGTDKKGNNKKVWYQAAKKPGWRQRVIEIVANTLTNWIHAELPGSSKKDQVKSPESINRLTPTILSQILGLTVEESRQILEANITSYDHMKAIETENVHDVGKEYDLKSEDGQKQYEASLEGKQDKAEIQAEMAADEADTQKEVPSKKKVVDDDKEVEPEEEIDTDVASGISNVGLPSTVSPSLESLEVLKTNIVNEELIADVVDEESEKEEVAEEGDLPALEGPSEPEVYEEDEPSTVFGDFVETTDVPQNISGTAIEEAVEPIEAPPQPPEAGGQYEVTQAPAQPKTTPDIVIPEGEMFEEEEDDKKAFSLLSLVRTAKIFANKGQYRKAQAINKFIISNMEKRISERDRSRTVIQVLSSLLSVSKVLQKEGKTEEASEINKIVKKNLERL